MVAVDGEDVEGDGVGVALTVDGDGCVAFYLDGWGCGAGCVFYAYDVVAKFACHAYRFGAGAAVEGDVGDASRGVRRVVIADAYDVSAGEGAT